METFSRETLAAPFELHPWYVTGFVEGGGVFTFSRSGAHIALYFALKLPAADRPILEAVQEYFGGAGRIYTVKVPAHPRHQSLRTHAPGYYRVARGDELERVIDHFQRYPLRGVKRAAFEIWREMADLKRAKFRRTHGDELELLAGTIVGVGAT